MEKHSNLTGKISFLIVLAAVFISSCASQKKEITSVVPPGAVRVTVIDYRDLDGCEFLLKLEDDQKLQPTNLPEAYKKNGISLDITFKYVNQMSICMAGRMVDLNFIQEVKESK